MKKTILLLSKITKKCIVLMLLFVYVSKSGMVNGFDDLGNEELEKIKNIESSIEDIYTVLIQIEENGGNITGHIEKINTVFEHIKIIRVDIKNNQSIIYEENYRNIIDIIETVKKDMLITLDNSYKLKTVQIRNKFLIPVILSAFILVIMSQFWKFIIKRHNYYILKKRPVLVDYES